MRTDKRISSKVLLWNKTKFSCLITVRVTRKWTSVSGENYQSDLGSGTVKRNVIDFLVSSDDVTNMFADVFPTTPTCGWLTADLYMCIGHSCPTRIDLSLWRNSFQSQRAFISESIYLISQKMKLACYLWFFDFHDSLVENHRYTTASCEHVWVSSASFHAYQLPYLFPIFFCESDDTLFTTGPLFHEYIDFLVEFSGCLFSRCAWFVCHVEYSTKKSYRQPTRWKDNRGVLETYHILTMGSFFRLIGNQHFYVMRNGATRENQNGAQILLYSFAVWLVVVFGIQSLLDICMERE